MLIPQRRLVNVPSSRRFHGAMIAFRYLGCSLHALRFSTASAAGCPVFSQEAMSTKDPQVRGEIIQARCHRHTTFPLRTWRPLQGCFASRQTTSAATQLSSVPCNSEHIHGGDLKRGSGIPPCSLLNHAFSHGGHHGRFSSQDPHPSYIPR